MKKLLIIIVLAVFGTTGLTPRASAEDTLSGSVVYRGGTFWPQSQTDGKVFDGVAWGDPVFDPADPAASLAAAQNLPNIRGDASLYVSTVDTLNLSLEILSGEDKNLVNAAMVAELLSMSAADGQGNSARPPAGVAADWSKISLAGVALSSVDLKDLQLTGAQINGTQPSMYNVNLSRLDLSGLDCAGRNFFKCNLSDVVGITGADLNLAGKPSGLGCVLKGVDLTGLDLSDRNIVWADFSGSNITVDQLNGQGTALSGFPDNDFIRVNLSGLSLAGLDLNGKNINKANLSNATGITGGDITSAGDIRGVVLTGLDLAGFDASGKDISNVIFRGSNVTMSMIENAPKTDLYYADFGGTGISEQNLLDAGWSSAQLTKVIY